MNNYYDYIIVGAGISGLYTALKLTNAYPDKTICIIEASEYIGGRLHSIKYDGIIVDGGGARFNTKQYRVCSLVKELDLINKLIPITNTINYKPIKPKYDISLETIFPTIDSFIVYLQKYIKTNNITEEELIETTILDLVDYKHVTQKLTHKKVSYKKLSYKEIKSITDEYPTIRQYLIDIYPYYSELGVLNALEGIKLFTNEFANKMKYTIFDGGMEQLASIIYDKLKKISNVKIFKSCPLEKIKKIKKIKTSYDESTSTPYSYYEVICTKYSSTNINKILNTNNLILTIPKTKLLKIEYLIKNKNVYNNLNSVQTEPLYRIYARYPLDKKTGKVWFDGMQKISTNLPIKYIIPINYKKGVIMISYTDSKFATYWNNIRNKDLLNNTNIFENILNKQLKELYPDIDIPKAKWFKHCHWDIGAGYWKSGYDRKKIINEIIQPINNEPLYICGENYSSHQAWVEGSLETSILVLSKLGIDITYKNKNNNNINEIKQIIKIRSNNSKRNSKRNSNYKNITLIKKMKDKKTKKNVSRILNKNNKTKTHNKTHSDKPEYTLEDVAKHNKRSDAWIVIGNKVADITKWIPKHPGGDIIMKGVGKDATKLFNSIDSHDQYARKMVAKYQIGILKK
jgi:cytochrome b involved in lipid metabolism